MNKTVTLGTLIFTLPNRIFYKKQTIGNVTILNLNNILNSVRIKKWFINCRLLIQFETSERKIICGEVVNDLNN